MHATRKKPEITTAIILETRVLNKEGKHPVKLRLTYQRKRKYYAIKGEHLSSHEFSNTYSIKSRGKNKERKRKYESVEGRAIEIIDNVLTMFSFDAFEREYLNKKTTDASIQSYFEAKAVELDNDNKIQTAVLYRAAIKSLLEYDKSITFQKITPTYLKKYEQYMLSENRTHTTIGMYIRNLKHIINRAIKNRVINEYPFGQDKDKYTIPVGKNTKKALTITDIEKLFNHEPENRNESLALQYWLFSYLSNGMNMVDIANLKYKNIEDGNLKFIRQKTKDTSKKTPIINVLLVPETWRIINNIGNEDKAPDNHIFPIFKPEYTAVERHKRIKQHIKQTNKYIRKIAKKIGLNEKITTYWARHTFSTILKRSGAPIEFISEQLGHQSTSVTKSYLDTFEDEQREKYSSKLLDFKKVKA